MTKRAWVAVIAFLALFLIIGFSARVLAQGLFSQGKSSGGDKVGLIHVEGVITGGAGQESLIAVETAASSLSIAGQIYQAAEDDSVKAIVIRVNSPGGSAAASDEIYRAIQECRKSKPVVVSMGDVAASGGYYIASAADYIFANGATLTGSIGVVFNMVNIEGLGEKLGIKDVTLTAGEHKDIGNPWRQMSESEAELLTGLLNDVHEQFIQAVAEGRPNLDEAQVRELATGMVFTGTRAKNNGLVDEVGGLHAAELKAKDLAGLPADAPVEGLGKSTSLLEQLLSLEGKLPISGGSLLADPLAELARGLYLSTAAAELVMR